MGRLRLSYAKTRSGFLAGAERTRGGEEIPLGCAGRWPRMREPGTLVGVEISLRPARKYGGTAIDDRGWAGYAAARRS